MYSGSGNRRGSLLEITGLSVLIHLSVSIFLFNGGGNPCDMYLWLVLWISRYLQNEKELIRLASAKAGGWAILYLCGVREIMNR